MEELYIKLITEKLDKLTLKQLVLLNNLIRYMIPDSDQDEEPQKSDLTE